jgi:hypothetical protein
LRDLLFQGVIVNQATLLSICFRRLRA